MSGINNMMIPEIKWESLAESDISRRLYKVLLKWAGFANSHYKTWAVRENCGHYFGGAYVYEMESASSALVASILASLGDYDEKLAGITRQEMKSRAIATIRYLCFTHTTGPEDCVRDISHHEMYSGKKWGFIYNNFFRDSQTGVGVSFIGLASWLLWKDLDDETRDMVERLVVSYADEYSGMTPGTGVYNDTQCEENAWTALGISPALYMFPGHPNSEAWLDGYIKWTLNSAVTFKDKLEKEWDKVTYQSRGGIVHDGKTYGVSSVTFHPDFTTENHGYVHPDYMSAGIILKMSSVVFWLLGGSEPPESAFYNVRNLYERAIKPTCGMDGNPIPVQGQDWFYHRHANKLFMHASMNLLFNDPDAAYFEEQCLSITEGRQDSTGIGALLEKNGKDLAVTPGSQSAFDMEGGMVRTIILSYLLHLTKGNGVKASSKEEVAGKLCGNHFYPYGGIYIHRTMDSFTSFTTRCSVMGLSIPSEGMWDITSDFTGLTGVLRKVRADDEYFAKKKINWKDLGIETENLSINEYKKGFSIYADIPRAGGDLRQSVSFSALPSGDSVYIEKVTALKETELAVFDTGRISIGNENFRELGSLAKGFRKVWFNEHEEEFRASYDGKNEIYDINDIDYINVDGSMGYLLYGSSGVRYINMHEYPKWKGLENILICNKGRTGLMRGGESNGLFAMVMLPNSTKEETAEKFSDTAITFENNGCMVLRHGGTRVSANLGNEDHRVNENFDRLSKRVDIFHGITRITANRIECSYDLCGRSSVIHEVMLNITPDGPLDDFNLEVLCMDNEFIWIHNNGKESAEYLLSKGDDNRRIVHYPGEVLKI